MVSVQHEPQESEPRPAQPEPAPDDSPFVAPPMEPSEKGRETRLGAP